ARASRGGLRTMAAAPSPPPYRPRRVTRALRAACRGDAEGFARRWRARASAWRLDRVNELIREHNMWYPIETRLPMDPRTGDYIRRGGRSYRRDEVGPAWILERFPPSLERPGR